MMSRQSPADPSMGQPEIPVIINKRAGRKTPFSLWIEKLLLKPPMICKEAAWTGQRIEKEIVDAFYDRGLKARPFVTQAPGHAKQIAEILVRQGMKWIAIAGGDGTVNEVVNAVAGSDVALGIIPLGTANALAIELGIPFSIRGAVEVITRKNIRTVDLGKVGGRFFIMGAGVSFDAEVVKNVAPAFKRIFGAFAYILTGLWQAVRYPFPRIEVRSEDGSGHRAEGYLAIVANARFYGGYFRAAPKALLDDGLFNVLIMKKKRVWNLLRYVSVMRNGDVTTRGDVEYFRCRELRVTGDAPVPVHVDAETAEMTPCDFKCVPKALRVIA